MSNYPYWKVAKFIAVEFDKTTDPPTPTGRREEWWAVDAGFIGNCGHHHPDEESAKTCLPAMEAKYRAVRWPKRKGTKQG